MEKPLTIKINDFREQLCKIINESKLHPYILLNELNAFAIEIQKKDHVEVEEYLKSLQSKGSEEKCKK